MKISEAIQQLQALIEQHGDVNIALSYSIRVSDSSMGLLPEVVDRNELRESRTAICLECDRHEVVKIPLTTIDFLKCRECGCAINAKVRLKSSKCPLGKW